MLNKQFSMHASTAIAEQIYLQDKDHNKVANVDSVKSIQKWLPKRIKIQKEEVYQSCQNRFH